MSFNKEALIRYRAIDACLRKRNKKYYRLVDLREAIEDALGKAFSISMLQKDLYAMRNDEALGYRAPIEYNRAGRGYYYSDPEYAINKLPLSENELESLAFAAQTLKQYSERGIFKHFDDAIEKIKQAVSMSSFIDNDSAIIQFEQAPVAQGSQWIQPLYKAIKDQLQVEISYKKVLSSEEKRYLVEPYLLKEYRQRWYVVGREIHKKRTQTFGLDRILALEIMPLHFLPDKKFDAAAYFKYSMGISTLTYSNPIAVELRFGAAESHFVLTQPVHPTQEIITQTAKYLDIRITVYESYELMSAVLSYGPNVEVLKPEHLRNLLKERIKEMSAKYH